MVLILFATVSVPALAQRVEITGKLEDWDCLRNRIFLSVQESRFLWSDQWQEWSFSGYTFGVETPAFVLGGVKRAGALKEMNNPGSYTPGSSVYFDETTISLDTSPGDAREWGAKLNIIPSCMHVFALQAEDEPLTFGGKIGVDPDEPVSLWSLASLSLLEPLETGDGWFYEERPFMEERLLHLIGGIRFTREKVRVGYLAGGSGSRLTPPGVFARLVAEVDTPVCSCRGLITCNGRRYRTWDGTFPRYRSSWGGSVHLFPEWVLQARGVYYRTYKRLPHIPVPYQQTCDHLEVKAGLVTDPVECLPAWSWKLSISEQGEISLDQEVEVDVKLQLAAFTLNLTPSYTWDYYGQSSKRLKAMLSCSYSAFRCELAATLAKQEQWSVKGSFRVDLTIGRTHGFFTLTLRELEPAGAGETILSDPFVEVFSLSLGVKSSITLAEE
jgi:hypothetical protein